MRNAKVELFDVALKGCIRHALDMSGSTSETTVVATRCEFAISEFDALVSGSLTSATFKNCVFYDNKYDGMYISNKAKIHLHGEATATHSNGRHGICANASNPNPNPNIASCQVVIHLPSRHNTSYNNGRQDRITHGGGTITNVED